MHVELQVDFLEGFVGGLVLRHADGDEHVFARVECQSFCKDVSGSVKGSDLNASCRQFLFGNPESVRLLSEYECLYGTELSTAGNGYGNGIVGQCLRLLYADSHEVRVEVVHIHGISFGKNILERDGIFLTFIVYCGLVFLCLRCEFKHTHSLMDGGE